MINAGQNILVLSKIVFDVARQFWIGKTVFCWYD